jgi:hypothetical protein
MFTTHKIGYKASHGEISETLEGARKILGFAKNKDMFTISESKFVIHYSNNSDDVNLTASREMWDAIGCACSPDDFTQVNRGDLCSKLRGLGIDFALWQSADSTDGRYPAFVIF